MDRKRGHNPRLNYNPSVKRKLDTTERYSDFSKRPRLKRGIDSPTSSFLPEKFAKGITQNVSTSNFQPVHTSFIPPNEKLNNTKSLHKSPVYLNAKTTSPPLRYSANQRLLNIRNNLQTLNVPVNPVQNSANSSKSCSSSSSPRCSNVTPSSLAKPSSLEERMNRIRNSINKQESNYQKKVTSPFQYQSQSPPAGHVNYLFNESLPSKSSKHESDDFMEWSYIEEKEILHKINNLRNDKIINRVTPNSEFQENIAKSLVDLPRNTTIFKNIYVVVDTNIFISYLSVVQKLLEIKINGVVSPIILIPWIVIQELDLFKDSRTINKLKRNSQTAIHFINEKLSSKHPQVKGQSVRDAAQQKIPSKSADDGILNCCLQILAAENRPMLLSNDVNLRNKAIINAVSAYSHKEIIHALDPYRNEGDALTTQNYSFDCSKAKEIELLFSNLFSFIIHAYLADAYGTLLYGIHPDVKNPPWPLKKCVNLFKKHWPKSLSMVLQKQFINKVNQLYEYLNQHGDLETITAMELKNLIDMGMAVCIYLQNGIPTQCEKIRECMNKIEHIIKELSLPHTVLTI